MKEKVRVLFMQTQMGLPAPMKVHIMLMRHFNRERVEVHVACSVSTQGEKSAALKVVEMIPDLHLRPTRFIPTIYRTSKLSIAKSIVFSGLPAIVSMLGLVRYVKRHHIDIIYCEDRSREAVLGILLAKLTGAKSIIHSHAKYTMEVSPLLLWAMRQADGIIGVSKFLKLSLVNNWNYPPEKVFSVLNGIEVKHWNPEADGSAIRNEFAIASNAPLLTIVANLVPSKGHEQLLKTLAQIKYQASNIKLLIVGEDITNLKFDGNLYSDYLKWMIQKLELSEQVIFAGQRKDIQQILAACDLYTMPAFDEGFGLVFLEAMAMKKPVVAIESGGVPEVVEHGKSGLISPPDDSTQLAENILTLLRNPALQTQMGDYGRQRVEEYFNAQRMADDVEKVYWLILGESIAKQQQQNSLVH